MRHVRTHREGVSNVISTVILASALLVVMLIASFVANDALSIQMSSSEFKAAEGLAITIEREINKIMFRQASSAAIKVTFSTTAPGYLRTGQNMTVSFSGGITKNYTIPLNRFIIEGRQEIGGAFEYDVLGDSSLLVTPYNGSFGRVHVSKPLQYRASLDFERVQYAYTGDASIFNGTQYVKVNTLEVTAIVLDFGSFRPSGNSLILVQNSQVLSDSFDMPSGNFSLTVGIGGGSEQIYLSAMGGDSRYPTLVRFHRVTIRISVVEGG